MKNLNNKEFEITKTTMRDLTSRELDQVGGASDCPSHIDYTVLDTNTINDTIVFA